VKDQLKKVLDDFFFYLGNSLIAILSQVGYTVLLLSGSLFYLRYAFEKRREILKQMYIAGVKSILVCSIVAFFTGMVLALQSGLQLKQFQQQALVGNLVITTMTKEMGPFTTALILTASVGAAMAAEIGTMKVTEQVDALEMMSISPLKFLIMPRVFALSIMLPIVTVYTTMLGVAGGAVVAMFQLELPVDTYLKHVYESLWFKDICVGMFKSFVFGFIISGICCSYGLRAENGVLGVGRDSGQNA